MNFSANTGRNAVTSQDVRHGFVQVDRRNIVRSHDRSAGREGFSHAPAGSLASPGYQYNPIP